MGIFFSRRLDSDAYYDGYEKEFDRLIKKSCSCQEARIRRHARIHFYTAWLMKLCIASLLGSFGYIAYMNRRPDGTYEHYEKPDFPSHEAKFISDRVEILRRSFICLCIPVLFYLIRLPVDQVESFLNSRCEREIQKLNRSKKKMLEDLKASTHFEKTIALIKKYSPDDPLLATVAQAPAPGIRMPLPPAPSQLLMRTGHAAAAAGKVIRPVFDTLATNFIGESPQLLECLRQSQAQLQIEQQKNAFLMRRLKELESKAGVEALSAEEIQGLRQQEAVQGQLTAAMQALQAQRQRSCSSAGTQSESTTGSIALPVVPYEGRPRAMSFPDRPPRSDPVEEASLPSCLQQRASVDTAVSQEQTSRSQEQETKKDL